MPLTFPSNPTVGQQSTQNGRVYAWTGEAWELAAVAVNVTPTAHKSSHATGGTDALTPADIGASAVGHAHSATDITSGTVATERLGSGTANSTTFLRGDSAYAPVSEVFEFLTNSAPASATGGNGTWSWQIPSSAKVVEFFLIGGGGGGGSGRRGAAGSARFGGGGGASGGVTLITRQASELLSRSLTINVGDGGAGGAARTTDDTNGSNGSFGTQTRVGFGSNTLYYLNADRGNGGNGGSATAGAGGTAGGAAAYLGSAGGASSATTNAGGSNAASTFACGGGGGGGGISTADVAFAGGLGRAQGWLLNIGPSGQVNANGGAAGGGNGQNAADVFTQVLGNQPGGSGGGGGGGNSTTAGGNGGNGLNFGGGGGGGGASFNGYNSGTGGNGGAGYVRITVWY